jgi:hypothetical protein
MGRRKSEERREVQLTVRSDGAKKGKMERERGKEERREAQKALTEVMEPRKGRKEERGIGKRGGRRRKL